jgi:hypothetical protein
MLILCAATLEQTHLIPSRILAPHARFYVREMRILAYAQLLESYRSLTLQSLSAAFGVTADFIDRYALRFRAFGIPNRCQSMNPQRTLALHRERPPALLDRQGARDRGDDAAVAQERAVRDGRAAGGCPVERGAAAEQGALLDAAGDICVHHSFHWTSIFGLES